MPKYKLYDVEKLYIPPEYQRDLKPHKIERMLSEWDEEKYDPIHVNVRNGGSAAAVFKGQHRYLTRVRQGKVKIGVWEHNGLTPQQEARYFAEEDQDREKLSPIDRFKALVFAGDEQAVGIQAVLDEHGFQIGLKKKAQDTLEERTIMAVGTVESLYNKGVLGATLNLVNLVWADQYQSTDAMFLRGIGFLLENYGHRLTDDHIDRFRDYAPQEIIQRSKPVRPGATNGKTRGEGVMTVLHKIAKLGAGAPKKTERPKG